MNRKTYAIFATFAVVTLVVIGWQAWDGMRQQPISMPESNQLLGYLGGKSVQESWVPVLGEAPEATEIKVTDLGRGSLILDFKMSGFLLGEIDIAGKICSSIDLPGHVKIQEAGVPELPYLATSLIIPAEGIPQFKILEHMVREMKVAPVEPSLGHITRNTNPDFIIPEFSLFYENGGMWPPEIVVMSKPFVIRDRRGINVRIQPLRYDGATGILYITERLVVEVATKGAGGENTLDPGAGTASGQEFDLVYDKLFSNQPNELATLKYDRLQTRGRMLIICHDDFMSDMDEFVQWKLRRGIDVALVSVSSAGGTNSGIKQFIQDWYDEPAGLTWVILVGDKDELPTNVGLYDGSDSDSMYALLAGDDLYPEVFISRISAQTSAQVQTQVAKFLAYEQNPALGEGATWYGQAIGIASNEGRPTDSERADLLRADLMGYNFSKVDRIYEGMGGSTSGIRAALEEGRSLVNYLGHGTGTGWASVAYRNSDLVKLNNVGRWPWIIDVSCSNGDFNLDECFAEAWLRAGTPEEPRGALGVIAATSLAPWVPPTVMQAEVVSLLTSDQEHSLGSLYYSGLMKVLDEYADLDVARWVMEQNVVFGDCSLQVRTTEPGQYEFADLVPPGPDDTTWAADVTGPAGSCVTLYWDGAVFGAGWLDETGHVEFDLTSSLTDYPNLLLTITGYNMVPYITTLTVGGEGEESDSVSGENEEDGEVLPSLPAEVKLLGNFPNPFNPATRIAFELPQAMEVNLTVYDIRGHQVKVLVEGVVGAGRHEMTWDGRDGAGRISASGVYLYNLVTTQGRQQGRMVLSK